MTAARPEDDARPDGHDDVLDVVERAVARLRAHPDRAVGADTDAALAGIDAVHRTALTRLVGALQAMGGESFMTRLVSDPAIRLLLMSYGLIAVDRRLMAEEALDAVRGHLHAHGVDVELVDVLGGVVSVEVHVSPDGALEPAAIRADLEAALRAELPGFQQLEIGARRPTPAGGQVFVALDAVRRPPRVEFHPVAARRDLAAGALLAVQAGPDAVVLAAVGDEVHAVRNRCGDSPLPLQFAALDGAVLTCNWHGCRYDVRTGARLDRTGQGLAVFPVRIDGDTIHVAVAVPPGGSRP